MTTAAVVGSGPNGLAAAVTLAQSGVKVVVYEAESTIGGGLRSTTDLTVPGLIHDECAAFHPMAVNSAFFASRNLENHGLSWAYPEIDAAHPLDNGEAGLLSQSIEVTARGLGRDGDRWQRTFAALSERYDDLAHDLFRPLFSGLPAHPVTVARYGVNALLPATLSARRFSEPVTRALFAGVAAHALRPLSGLLSSAIGMMMIAAGHRNGWPVAVGGSQSIANALHSLLREHGGRIETGRRVSSLGELGSVDLVLLDLEPGAAARILGDALPRRVKKAYTTFRRAPSAFKVDLAIEGAIPWTNADTSRAGTVHLGGSMAEIRNTERQIQRGTMPERPFVLVGQQFVADSSRSQNDVHPVYAYAHVPHAYTGDATESILAQFERFAPGTRDRIMAMHIRGPEAIERHNTNFVGGDIITGQNDVRYTLSRPLFALNPYSTGIDGVYLCSAATPPGAGAHGLCGYNAAESALRYLAGGGTRRNHAA